MEGIEVKIVSQRGIVKSRRKKSIKYIYGQQLLRSNRKKIFFIQSSGNFYKKGEGIEGV
ncbi:unnamed protein product [Meloidogyne enterolobii]|uniref:Uncharacterized protein n=1 Tax=Meloidogyne enterolobii TaxID=390850 RepID=A0ACB0YK86_MELEN